jgi:hypothetical protein
MKTNAVTPGSASPPHRPRDIPEPAEVAGELAPGGHGGDHVTTPEAIQHHRRSSAPPATAHCPRTAPSSTAVHTTASGSAVRSSACSPAARWSGSGNSAIFGADRSSSGKLRGLGTGHGDPSSAGNSRALQRRTRLPPSPTTETRSRSRRREDVGDLTARPPGVPVTTEPRAGPRGRHP